MKKIILAATFLFGTSAMAAHGPAGFGLGEMIFKGKEGLTYNVLAATFNGSSGNQTFAMSTGTLGCEKAKTAKVAAVSFVENNLVALSNNISAGNGETLGAYLALINALEANRTKLQQNFAQIFASNSAENIHNNILKVVKM